MMTTVMETVKYHMKCGCVIKLEDIVRVYIKTSGMVKQNLRYACPKHRKEGLLDKRTNICMDCKQEFICDLHGPPPFRCPECKNIHLDKYAKKLNDKWNKIRKEKRNLKDGKIC